MKKGVDFCGFAVSSEEPMLYVMQANSHTVTTTSVPCCLVHVVELCHWIVEHLRERIQYIIISDC